MAEINYNTENCWQIKEVLPIKCTKVKNRHNEWDIIIPKMAMSWDTFIDMETSITHMESYGISYNFIDGIATMSVTKKGLEELEKMPNIISII